MKTLLYVKHNSRYTVNLHKKLIHSVMERIMFTFLPKKISCYNSFLLRIHLGTTGIMGNAVNQLFELSITSHQQVGDTLPVVCGTE